MNNDPNTSNSGATTITTIGDQGHVFFCFFQVDFVFWWLEIYPNNMVKLFYKWSENPFVNKRNPTSQNGAKIPLM
jgi:hypothetical protein